MKVILANITGNLVSLLCVGSAVYLAAHDKDIWGWFLFAALLTSVSYSFSSKKSDD
jgi:hypothetical protein